MHEPCPDNDFLAPHVTLMLDSYRQWLGAELTSRDGDDVAVAQRLYEAEFAIISHGTGEDPVLYYANRTTTDLFEMTWSELTSLPSRMSAEPIHRAERERLMQRVRANGYIDDYSGVRISSTGRRIYIDRATVWNLVGPDGEPSGQAAVFSHWESL